MIEESFMPFDRHFDSGFGATADTFHDAAKALNIDEHKHGFGLNSSRLPVFYLYRHANELYFKSILTILHRRFSSHFPNVDCKDFPTIIVNGKAKRIFSVHSIHHLYTEFIRVLSVHADEIRALGRTDWTVVPDGVDEMVALIEDADESSTMFRYPMTLDPLNDAEKSSFKRMRPADISAVANHRTDNNLPGVKVLAVKNDDNEIVESFVHDDNAMPDVFDALVQLADTFSGAQFGMRAEFLDGR